MNWYKLQLLLILLVGLNGNAQNKPAGNKIPVKDVKASQLDYEYVPNDPLKARIYTLPNGLKVYLSVYKNAPRIQTLIGIKAGSKNDPAQATGLAHYLEHMVFKGTDKYGTKDWAKESIELQKIEKLYQIYGQEKDQLKRKQLYRQIDSVSGIAAKYAIANEYDKMLAAIGADGTNASTSFDETVYINEIPSNQVENFLKIESERFRKLVLRLFHTELEAVYEEKNRGMDDDQNKVYEAAMAALWKKHTYGTQTTIGTIDHLKNPSMVEIHNFFNKYYVPNNMAIVMSGDFDPDQVIKQINKHFGGLKPKPVDSFTFTPEDPINEKREINIYGPDPSNVNLAWRFNGKGSQEEEILTLLTGILYNGTAGLIDLNLNQSQKALGCNAILWPLKDYSLFSIGGQPIEGQSLKELEQLILEQLELIKKGEFPDWMMDAVLTDIKLQKTKSLENNGPRAEEMLNAFVSDIKWSDNVNRIERLSKITKKDIVEFTNKNFSKNNYVIVYKHVGEDTTVQKVDKPEITPVEVNRDDASPFVQKIMNSTPPEINPVFIDYKKDILQDTLKANIPLIYTKNDENKLFQLYFKFNMGNNNDVELPIAVEYIPLCALKDMNAEKIQQEFYKLGCNLDVYCDNENTWIRLTGLNESFEKSVNLLENILSEGVVEQEALTDLKGNILKTRNDAKQNKGLILNEALLKYALYGPLNPFTHVISNDELNKLNVEQIQNKIRKLLSYPH